MSDHVRQHFINENDDNEPFKFLDNSDSTSSIYQDSAFRSYLRALRLNPDQWDVLKNLFVEAFKTQNSRSFLENYCLEGNLNFS